MFIPHTGRASRRRADAHNGPVLREATCGLVHVSVGEARKGAAAVSDELTSRLAKTIGADPTLTQSIRIDVNVRNEPTVTVTRLADADQIGRIIQCSAFADYTLVENKELKRLRKAATLTASEQVAIKWAAEMLEAGSLPRTLHQDSAATLRGLLERLG